MSYGSDLTWWVMEREWNYNRPNVSCVPRDEYTLERHNTDKYPNTWALIGDGVSHQKSDKPRFACVGHRAVYPSDLEGCFTVCLSINAVGMAIGSREAWDEVGELFNGASGPIKILMNQ